MGVQIPPSALLRIKEKVAILKFLGTSASIPTKQRDNTSFLFKYKNNSFLIDCPGSVVYKLLKVGENYKKVKKVVITHHHPDHIYGIISLIHTQMNVNNQLTIFSSNPSIKIIKQLAKIFKLDKPGYPKIKYINVFAKKYFFSGEKIKLKALKNTHTEGSFGIKVLFGNKKLIYSSDTSFSENLLQELGKSGYIIHDCTASGDYFKKHPKLFKMHTCSGQLAAHLKNKPKVTLIPVHFLLTENKEWVKIRRDLSCLKGRVIFVKDYQKVSL